MRLLYTPAAMVFAQLLVASPFVAGFTRAAVDLLDPHLVLALRADGAGDGRIGYELARAAGPRLLVAVAGPENGVLGHRGNTTDSHRYCKSRVR